MSERERDKEEKEKIQAKEIKMISIIEKYGMFIMVIFFFN